MEEGPKGLGSWCSVLLDMSASTQQVISWSYCDPEQLCVTFPIASSISTHMQRPERIFLFIKVEKKRDVAP